MTENELTYKIIGAIYKVYNELGPGLLESVYEKVLVYQLRKEGLTVAEQVNIPIVYDGKTFDNDLRADIIVDDEIILELKSVNEMRDLFYKQLLTYLKLSNRHLGLLVNFNTSDMRSSIHRVINGYR